MKSGVRFIRGSRHRIELHWSQDGGKFSLDEVLLYRYRIPMIGSLLIRSIKFILNRLNRQGEFVGFRSLDDHPDVIKTWLEGKRVDPIQIEGAIRAIYHYLSWDDIDKADQTLFVLEEALRMEPRISRQTLTFLQTGLLQRNALLAYTPQEIVRLQLEVNLARGDEIIKVVYKRGECFVCRWREDMVPEPLFAI